MIFPHCSFDIRESTLAGQTAAQRLEKQIQLAKQMRQTCQQKLGRLGDLKQSFVYWNVSCRNTHQ